MTQVETKTTTTKPTTLDSNLIKLVNNEGITGVVYHKDMLKHECEGSDHPEQPARISSIYNSLDKQGLLDKIKLLITSREITNDELLTTHPQKHINYILNNKKNFYGDYFMNKHTPRASKLSAGSVIQLMELVANKNIENGIAIIRPPGHHMNYDFPSGFCVFNNVAIGINVIRKKYPKVKKYCVVDIDVHHGNGTQALFEQDPDVLYISTHRGYGFYPNTGKNHEVGKGKGKGFNVNVNMKGYMGSREYLYTFNKLLLPIIKEYKPDMIIISAGFDACIGDPLGGMNIIPPTYGKITSELLKICKNTIIVLEGGYNLISMPSAVTACVYSLLNPDKLFNLNEFEKSINDLKLYNKWKNINEAKLYNKIISENDKMIKLKKLKDNKNNKDETKESENIKIDPMYQNYVNRYNRLFKQCIDNINDCIKIQKSHWKCLQEDKKDKKDIQVSNLEEEFKKLNIS